MTANSPAPRATSPAGPSSFVDTKKAPTPVINPRIGPPINSLEKMIMQSRLSFVVYSRDYKMYIYTYVHINTLVLTDLPW